MGETFPQSRKHLLGQPGYEQVQGKTGLFACLPLYLIGECIHSVPAVLILYCHQMLASLPPQESSRPSAPDKEAEVSSLVD